MKKQKIQSMNDALKFQFERIFDEFENLSHSLEESASDEGLEYRQVPKLINLALDSSANSGRRYSILELKQTTL